MKLNKCICFLLAILILISNIGVAISVHYCGGEVASVTLNTVFSKLPSDKKCCGDIEMDSNCCKNKMFHFQKKSDDSILKFVAFNFEYCNYLSINNNFFATTNIELFANKKSSFYCNSNAPPLYQLYHQYIFYG